MAFNKEVAEILVKTGAYKDLPAPKILTSGALGIYYINTEKIAQDGGDFEKEEIGGDASNMAEHARKMVLEHPEFARVVDILYEEICKVLPNPNTPNLVISGGMRRDLFFSVPVADLFNAPHISLYKQDAKNPSRAEFVFADGEKVNDSSGVLDRYTVIHIADLLTEANSVYRIEKAAGRDFAKGWVPMIRERGGNVTEFFSVVSRKQGGEENLAAHGVKAHSLVDIDEEFLEHNSNNPERAVAYLRNPEEWTLSYLAKNGALEFVDDFDPSKKNIERADKFLKRYARHLSEAKKLNELLDAVSQKYNCDIKESLNEFLAGGD